MNWFDRFRVATLAASVSLLATFCVGGVEATAALLVALFLALGAYVIQNEIREICLRQFEIRRKRERRRRDST